MAPKQKSRELQCSVRVEASRNNATRQLWLSTQQYLYNVQRRGELTVSIILIITMYPYITCSCVKTN